jgi:hypothetical protein
MYKADTGWPTIGIGIGIGSLESSWMASDSLEDDRWILLRWDDGILFTYQHILRFEYFAFSK